MLMSKYAVWEDGDKMAKDLTDSLSSAIRRLDTPHTIHDLAVQLIVRENLPSEERIKAADYDMHCADDKYFKELKKNKKLRHLVPNIMRQVGPTDMSFSFYLADILP